LSAEINGVSTIEFRHGSLLDPLTERVDLLVSNPPFVITPRSTGTTFEYRDAGMTGDALVRRLFTAVPAVLTPGGRSVCLGNWETTSGNDEGPEAWVGEADTSVLVIEREALDPVAYAETWIRDGGIARATPAWDCAIADWLDDFASRSADHVVFGHVLLARSQGADDGVFRAREPVAWAAHPGTGAQSARTRRVPHHGLRDQVLAGLGRPGGDRRHRLPPVPGPRRTPAFRARPVRTEFDHAGAGHRIRAGLRPRHGAGRIRLRRRRITARPPDGRGTGRAARR